MCRSQPNPKSKTMRLLTQFQHQVPVHQNQPEKGAGRESLAARVGSVPERLYPASSPLLLQTWNVPSRTPSSCFARFLWIQTPSGKDTEDISISLDFLFMVTLRKIDLTLLKKGFKGLFIYFLFFWVFLPQCHIRSILGSPNYFSMNILKEV